MLAEIRRTLEGRLVADRAPDPWLWSETDVYAEHKRRYRRGARREGLRRGFAIRRVTSFVTLLLPLMVADRARGG